MDITGSFNRELGVVNANTSSAQYWNSVNGAFTTWSNMSSSSFNHGTGGVSHNYNTGLTFTASRSWTGETSSNGNHTHKVTAAGSNSNTGVLL